MSRAVRTILICCLLAAVTACDKVPLLAPTSSTITLSVNTTTVPVNGTATVTASVTESAGTPPQNGTVVTFTSSFGTMEPAEARTEGGKATAIFHAGTQSGTAKIGAFSGATRATEVDLLVGGAAAERIAVRAEPATVPRTGGTVELISVVTDASGNPLVGAPVIFTADNGTLASNSGVTNQNGVVTTNLTTNRETIVRASVATKEATVTVRAVDTPSVTISTPTTSPAVGSPVVFTITPAGGAGANPIQNVTINWGDGSANATLGSITGATSITHSFNSSGAFTVTATVTDVNGLVGTTSTVVVVQRNLPTVTLTATPNPVTAGTTVSFTVSAQAAAGAPALQSVRVVVVPSGETIFTGVAGSNTFTRAFNTAGTYTVTATATDVAGTSSSASIQLVVTQRGAIEMTLDASDGATCTSTFPKSCIANGRAPNVRVQFTAAFTSTTPSDITGYTWSFGDGSSETTTNRTTDHIFVSAGTYVVTVTVNTGASGSGSARLTLTVNSIQ